MRRIGLIALVLVSVTALSGAIASTSMANICVRVEEPGTGAWANGTCTTAGAPKEWIKIQGYTAYLGNGQWCAEVESGETGNYTDAACTTRGTGRFIRVYEHPDWFVNGAQLKVGTKQIKLQVKGEATLKAETKPTAFEIKCGGSRSEVSTIGGNGTSQGQAKGRLTFSSCKTKLEGCETTTPTLTTNETKSYLATRSGSQTKIVEVFEPTEGEKYIEFKLKGKCGVIPTETNEAVIGTIAAELLPAGDEQKEGLLNFPEKPITEVDHEGTIVKPSMKFASIASVFYGGYGAKLVPEETFGAFGAN